MNYDEILLNMEREGFRGPRKRFSFCMPNAKAELESALRVVANRLGEPLVWLPEYNEVANWLSDNKGRGLYLFGAVGRGKSLLIRYVLPMIFRARLNRVFKVVDCANSALSIDQVLNSHFIALDDLGAESDTVDYGTRRQLAVEAICKAQDDPGVFLIASSNYDSEALLNRYGNRVFDRIKYLFHRIPFNGPSMRK